MIKRNLILPNSLLNKINVIYLSLLKVEKHLPDNPNCLIKKRSVCENENDMLFLGMWNYWNMLPHLLLSSFSIDFCSLLSLYFWQQANSKHAGPLRVWLDTVQIFPHVSISFTTSQKLCEWGMPDPHYGIHHIITPTSGRGQRDHNYKR